MLGEMTFLDLDLAAPAGRAAAADALDIDAERARGIEHRRADRKAAALAGRHEEDEGIGHAWGCRMGYYSVTDARPSKMSASLSVTPISGMSITS